LLDLSKTLLIAGKRPYFQPEYARRKFAEDVHGIGVA
jgi:hypothetical protein